MRALAGTLNSIGTLLVLPITGYISDRFGRRVALVVNIFNFALFGTIRAFSTSYAMYLVLQILQTTLGAGLYSSAYIFVFLTICYYWILGESVRWLLSKQKYTEARSALQEVAKVNKTTISEKSLEALVNPKLPTTVQSPMLYWEGIPSVLFAGMALLAGILVLTQPETLGTKLTDTLAEAEALGKTIAKQFT
ncbi:unnamed protein product, partial [Iphiclides podalirius]